MTLLQRGLSGIVLVLVWWTIGIMQVIEGDNFTFMLWALITAMTLWDIDHENKENL